MPDEKPEDDENFRSEYREVAANHRFYVGLRFIIAAFTATLQSGLMTFYNQAMEVIRKLQEAARQRGELPEPLELHQVHPLSITIVGIITMLAVSFMERRNISRLVTMVTRGTELEVELRLTNGQYGRLKETNRFNLLTYTWSLAIVYWMLIAMWAFLLGFNIMALI